MAGFKVTTEGGGVRHATGDRIAIFLFELISKPAKQFSQLV